MGDRDGLRVGSGSRARTGGFDAGNGFALAISGQGCFGRKTYA